MKGKAASNSRSSLQHQPTLLAANITGDEVVVVINKARPIPLASSSSSSPQAASTSAIQKVRRGDVRRAVVVRTRFPIRRADGRTIRFVAPVPLAHETNGV